MNLPEAVINQRLKLTVKDFVSVNHYLAYRALIKNGKPMAMSYKTQEAKKFQKDFTAYVIDEVEKQGWVTDPNPFQHYYVDAMFYFPRVDMDCNNYWKVAFDAITDSGVIWMDDNMACERVVKVQYDSKNPRIEYEIYPTDFIGVWDTWDGYTSFLNQNCNLCKKDKLHCSILKKALEGRVQDDINLERNACYKCKEKGLN